MQQLKESQVATVRLPIIKFYNCLLLRNHDLVRDDLWIRGSKILDPENHFFNHKHLPDREIDCKGAIISPGFIDVQINGKFGRVPLPSLILHF